jgi:tRNA pseudouridine55 synthase
MTSGNVCVKHYEAVGCFGAATDTYDCTGAIVKTAPSEHITRNQLEDVIKSRFVGEIQQRPPVFSALRVDGKRMYDLARDKNAVLPELPARPVTVFDIRVLEFTIGDGETIPTTFRLHIACGGGTYIRSIIHDIGEALASCAYMSELTRTRQGPFVVGGHVVGEPVSQLALEIPDLTDFAALRRAIDSPKVGEYVAKLSVKHVGTKRPREQDGTTSGGSIKRAFNK